ncbi:hypothetical protein N9T96_00215 [Flavobacteriaceae bacterium]|jgi:hypothetical protein|nr:hypothetical protein [Flavobacteriaceae bacterium]
MSWENNNLRPTKNMLVVLVKIKLEPKIGVLSQLKLIPLILGKVRTQHILPPTNKRDGEIHVTKKNLILTASK